MKRLYRSKLGLPAGEKVRSLRDLAKEQPQAVCLYFALRELALQSESVQMTRFECGGLIAMKDPASVTKALNSLAMAGWIERTVVVVPEGVGWARKVNIRFTRMKGAPTVIQGGSIGAPPTKS